MEGTLVCVHPDLYISFEAPNVWSNVLSVHPRNGTTDSLRELAK